MDKKSNLQKRLGVMWLVIILMLCVVMIMNSPHVVTLFNSRVASQSFEDININQSSKKDTRADDFVMPESWWSDGFDISLGFDGGTGATDAPYLISTSAQLALMASKINNEGGAYLTSSYQLTADIDMSEKFWSPMGTWSNGRAFVGTFDGGSYEMGDDGELHGVVHTINGLIMKNRESVDNGSTVGFFGVLGDQAVITNVIFDNSIAYLDYELDLDKDSERVTLAIVASQVKNDATVLFQNMAVLNSSTFAPQTLSEDGENGIDFIHVEVKSGIFVAWQQGVEDWGDSAKGVIYMTDVHARMSSILINIYLDLDGWDMSPDIVVNSFGGLIGEARQVDIQNSSYEGLIGVEVVRRDRNMDNAQFIFNAGGAIGTMDAYNSSTSYFNNIDLSGTIYLDTFKNENDGFNRNTASVNKNSNTNNNSNNTSDEVERNSNKDARDNGAVPWASDIRQIGTVIGDANIWGLGDIEISDVTASFFVDAPKGNNITLGDQQEPEATQSIDITGGKSLQQAILDGDYDSPEIKATTDQMKAYAYEHATLTGQKPFEPHTKAQIYGDASLDSMSSREGNTGLEGPPTAPAGPIVFVTAAPALVFMMSYVMINSVILSSWMAVATGFSVMAGVLMIVVAVIIIVALVVFAVLFAFWGAMKPKWESNVYVGGAIGSFGRSGIKLKNVRTANAVIASDTLFSKDDGSAEIIDSHNTTPTMGMLVHQPESPMSNEMGDRVHLEVSGKGTVMSNGSIGADSILEYQWYYNTIDSNNILDGSEHGLGGAKTVKVEGATASSLDLNIDWVGSRFYFVKQINHVIEFRGNVNSVTARVGNRKTSLKPAEIIQQPDDISIKVGVEDTKLNVVATASGDIDYQWYYNTQASTDGAVMLPGMDKSEIVPLQKKSGTYYYYVIVSVSLNDPSQNQILRSEVISRYAKVDVLAVANDIKILVQPDAERTVELNRNTILGVQVDTNTINGILSYQWFKASIATSDGVAIKGETNQSLVVDTGVNDSVNYYYVIITNTVENSSKSVRSNVSKITVSRDEALALNMVHDVESVSGLSSDETLSVSIYATAESGGQVRYQWFQVESLGNTNGDPMPGETNGTLAIISSVAYVGYYYVAVYTTKSNGNISQIQYSKTVSVEFKDANQYKFDQATEEIKNTKITTIEYDSNSIVDQQSSSSVLADLQITLDVDKSINISYQWFKSDSVVISDAVAINGAVGNLWRVYKDSDVGQKFYFIKIILSSVVYSPSQGGYITVVSETDLSPVALLHPPTPVASQNDSNLIIIIAAAVGMLFLLGICFIILKNSRKLKYRNSRNMYNNGFANNGFANNGANIKGAKTKGISSKSSKNNDISGDVFTNGVIIHNGGKSTKSVKSKAISTGFNNNTINTKGISNKFNNNIISNETLNKFGVSNDIVNKYNKGLANIGMNRYTMSVDRNRFDGSGINNYSTGFDNNNFDTNSSNKSLSINNGINIKSNTRNSKNSFITSEDSGINSYSTSFDGN